MSIESTDGDVDFAILPKSLVKNSVLSQKNFEDLYFKYMRDSKTNVEAYEKAEQVHEQYFDRRRYSSFDSFRTQKNKK